MVAGLKVVEVVEVPWGHGSDGGREHSVRHVTQAVHAIPRNQHYWLQRDGVTSAHLLQNKRGMFNGKKQKTMDGKVHVFSVPRVFVGSPPSSQLHVFSVR